MPRHIPDPLEERVDAGLAGAGFVYCRETENPARLDFLVASAGAIPEVHVEVKRFHTDRTNEQLKRADNVIVLQGEGAVDFFCMLLGLAEAVRKTMED